MGQTDPAIRKLLQGALIAAVPFALSACGGMEHDASYRTWEESRLAGLTCQKRHDGDGALQKMHEALESARNLHGDPLRQAISLLDVAELTLEKGEVSNAEQFAKDAAKRLSESSNHSNSELYKEQQARAHLVLGDALSADKEFPQAIASYKEALAIYDALIKPDNKSLLLRHYRIRTNMVLSDALDATGDKVASRAASGSAFDEALNASAPAYLLDAAREQYAARLRDANDLVAAKAVYKDVDAMKLLGDGLSFEKEDDPAHALKCFEAAYKLVESSPNMDGLKAKICNQLARVHNELKHPEETIRFSQKALDCRRACKAPYGERDNHLLTMIAMSASRLGDYDLALNKLNEELKIKEQLYDKQNHRTMDTLTHMIYIAHRSARGEQAPLIAQASVICDAAFENKKRELPWNYIFRLANTLHATGHFAEAKQLYERLLDRSDNENKQVENGRLCSLYLQLSWITATNGDTSTTTAFQQKAFAYFSDLNAKGRNTTIERLEKYRATLQELHQPAQLKLCESQLARMRSAAHDS